MNLILFTLPQNQPRLKSLKYIYTIDKLQNLVRHFLTVLLEKRKKKTTQKKTTPHKLWHQHEEIIKQYKIINHRSFA